MRSWILIGVLALSLGGFAAMGVLAGPGGSGGDSTEGDSLSPPATIEEPDDGSDALSPPAEIDDGEDDGGDALSPPADIDDGDDGAHGVPDGSPACDNHEDTDGNGDGCGTVTNCGGQELHLPQPAVDNMNGNHCDEDSGAVDDANDDANDGEHDANDDESQDDGDNHEQDQDHQGSNHGPGNQHDSEGEGD